MNVFYLNTDPEQAATWHCDKHVVKMIIEYAQLLSTAHRLLDGEAIQIQFSDQRVFKGVLRDRTHRRTFWAMPNENVWITDVPYRLETVTTWPPEKRKAIAFDNALYAASHLKHPCALWIRDSAENYLWLYNLFAHLCNEYTHRYGRVHTTDKRLRQLLSIPPKNIPVGQSNLPVPQAMPDEFKHPDAVTAYQNLYVGSKSRFAKWTNRRPPAWFIERIENYDSTHFERAGRMAPPEIEGGGQLHQVDASEDV